MIVRGINHVLRAVLVSFCHVLSQEDQMAVPARQQMAIQRALGETEEWLLIERNRAAPHAKRFLMCVGLIVLEQLRDGWPVLDSAIVAQNGSLRSTEAMVQRILSRFGVSQTILRSGGRTTPAAAPAALRLADRLNQISVIAALSQQERQRVADKIQLRLVEEVRLLFAASEQTVVLSPSLPTSTAVNTILDSASTPRATNALLRCFTEAAFTTLISETLGRVNLGVDDGSQDRFFAFVLGSTMLSVSTRASIGDLREIEQLQVDGYRITQLVRGRHLSKARQIASQEGVGESLWVTGIEDYLATLIDYHASYEEIRWQRIMEQILTQHRSFVLLRRITYPISIRAEFNDRDRAFPRD
jgi:hypothetical protein